MVLSNTRSALLLLILSLLMTASCMWRLAAADSTIQNVSGANLLINGRPLFIGETLTVGIQVGRSTGNIDMSYVRTVTGLQIKNNRRYFVIDNQQGNTGTYAGRTVRTLDLVEGRDVEVSF